jgi:DNA-directed DNA polymerase III PolC
LLLLAQNHAGYSNLCALVTQRQIEERPVTLEELNAHRAGLIALFAGGQRPVASDQCRTMKVGRVPDARVTGHRFPATGHRPLVTGHFKDIFGDALYLEAHHLSPGDGRALRETLRLGRDLGVPVVATNNVHFLKPEEHLHHRVLNAIRTGTLLSKIDDACDAQGRRETAGPEAYFKSPAEMQRAFPDHPELLQRTLEIAGRCNLQLELGKTIFPEFPVPAGETPFSHLWKLCFEGAQRRYQPLRPEALRRLTHELDVINKLRLAPYFLLVHDIVEEARRRNIPAVARGSAASSIVTYCLGISRVCPLRWNLYFERFLNEQRGDIPDIDLDICGARRDELLDYVYQRWGQQHVAMISSFITMHARLAVREVAKVFGVAPREVNHFTHRLPHRPVREILEAIRTLPECRTLPAHEEPWRTILDVALRLDDFPRHLGIHPCGTVIAAQPLTRLVPLEWATKGIVVTQYDMHAVEALGLIKMDLLGQRGLTTMSLALRNIDAARRGAACCARQDAATGVSLVSSQSEISHLTSAIADSRPPGAASQSAVNFDAIPEHDPLTCDMIAAGRTLGLFQIESPGMRGLLRTMRARTLEEVCLALALIRPGASEYGSKECFLKRIRGQEPVHYPHPCLEPILRDSLGVCVYQEQVMQIAQAAGGMNLAEADLVRRASAKFADNRERERLRSKFLKAAAQLGLEGPARDAAWGMVEKFAGFGFCKAHAATYADLSYRMAYLKAHYPAEFLAAMCSSGAGFYHVSAYVEEAKRCGIEVRLPSVNHSQCEYTTECAGQTSRSVHVHSGDRATETRDSGILAPALASAANSGNNRGVRAEGTDLEVGPAQRAIRVGLMQVKGLRAETIAAIVQAREERGPFHSLEDFLRRVSVERDEIETLIKCGAFDDAGQTSRSVHVHSGDRATETLQAAIRPFDCEPGANGDRHDARAGGTALEAGPASRPALLWQLNLLAGPREAPTALLPPSGSESALLFPDAAPLPLVRTAAPPLTADYSRGQRLCYEMDLLEVCVSGHPLDRIPRNGEAWSTELYAPLPHRRGGFTPPETGRDKPAPTVLPLGRRFALLGWVITFRRVGTKTYRNMMFVTLEDQRGIYEAVLFPEAYQRYGGLVFETRLLRVTGRLEAEGTLNCDKLEAVRP